MDCPATTPETPQPRSPSSISSGSSVDIVVSPASVPPKTRVSYPALSFATSSPYDLASLHPDELRTAAEKARGLDRIYLRRAARCPPSELAQWRKRKLEKLWLTASAKKLLKKAGVKKALKRARRTKIKPRAFQTIEIEEYSDERHTTQVDPCCEGEVQFDASDVNAFAGRIVKQDMLTAMEQALTEHTKNGMSRLETRSHSYYVDAAVSSQYESTGLAVVCKTHRDHESSPWVVQGFQINQALGSTDAEIWAILQAMRNVRQQVQADRRGLGQDICTVAVIYSDCLSALERIEKVSLSHQGVTKMAIKESIELRRLGVDVQIHWVPGHRSVPGNELADRVAKRARQPIQ